MTEHLYRHLAGNEAETTSSSSETVTEIAALQLARQRTWAIALFSLTTILLFADQNLLSPNLTAVASEFGFSDQERDKKLGGDISLAFFLLGAPASFIVGVLGDSHNRTKLFAWTVALGEGACLLTYFVTTYKQLYVTRALTGLSIGGAIPLIHSILGDLVVAEQRHTVTAFLAIGTGIGISFGQGVAGFLGPTLGWRLPFLVIAIPALLCAVLVWLTVSDPDRGAMEHAVLDRSKKMKHRRPNHEHTTDIEMDPRGDDRQFDGDEMIHTTCRNMQVTTSAWSAFLYLMQNRTVLLSLLQGAPGCVPWGIVNAYLNDFLSQDRNMSVQQATMIMLIFGLGNFLGMVLGGAGGSALYRINKRYPPVLAGLMAIFGCFPFWLLLNKVHGGGNGTGVGKKLSLLTLTISSIAGLCSGVTGVIVKASLTNATLPETRGQAFALFNTFNDFGRGLGPVFVAFLISRLGGRTPAFNVGVLGWMICGVFNLLMYFTIQHDEDQVQATIAARLPVDESTDNSGSDDEIKS